MRGGRGIQKARAAQAKQGRVQRSAPLGEGSRFAALAGSIKAGSAVPGRKKIEDPEAVAAAVGRAKYGKEAFAKMSARGRRKS